MPGVSVIIAVYNEEKNIREAVESILNQTYKDIEVIIVNDASTDDTYRVIKEFEDERIHVINHEEKLGPSISRNHAIEKSSGAYIAIMDADDVSLPHRLERQVNYLDKHHDFGVVGSAMLEMDPCGVVLFPAYFPEDNDTIQKMIINNNCFFHSSIMFRKSIFQEVGGYRAEFELSEDYDLLLRFAEISKMYNFSDILCKRRWNPYGLSFNKDIKLKKYGMLARTLANERRSGKKENLLAAKNLIIGEDDFTVSLIERLRSFLMLSNAYYGAGCIFMYKGDIKKARGLFSRCLKYNLLHIKGLACLTATFFPNSFIRYLKFLFIGAKKYNERIEGKVKQ